MAFNNDHIKYATAYAIIAAFLFDVAAVVFIEIPEKNREIFVHMMGLVDGAFIGGLVAYYYTKSSSERTNNQKPTKEQK